MAEDCVVCSLMFERAVVGVGGGRCWFSKNFKEVDARCASLRGLMNLNQKI